MCDVLFFGGGKKKLDFFPARIAQDVRWKVHFGYEVPALFNFCR